MTLYGLKTLAGRYIFIMRLCMRAPRQREQLMDVSLLIHNLLLLSRGNLT